MIRFTIRRPVTVAMAYFAVALLGVAAWRNLPIEFLPDTRLPRLTITATWRGASPETTEAFLTSPLEAVVQQVRGVQKVTSESRDQGGMGVAYITVEFAHGTDMDFARLELSERITSLVPELPAGVGRPQISQYVPREFQEQTRPFLSYTLTGPYTLEALRAYVDDVIAPELRQVDGVAAVEAYGGRARVLEIRLDEAKIQALGITPDLVRARLQDLEVINEAGVVNVGGVLRTLAIRERAASVTDVLRLPLMNRGGRIIRVQDVGTVHDTYEEAQSYYRIDGKPAVSFNVHKAIRTNAVRTADRVKERLAALETHFPPGVRLILDHDESEGVRKQLTDLRQRALVSAVVVFVVLLVFLRSFESSLIVFATIGFSVLIALNLMYWAGYTLNILTLMGLAMGFGLVVDNAIVVLENMYRLRRAGMPAEEAAEVGAREVVLAILAATLTTVVVLIPFVYLQGELRMYYVPLAIVVGLSLLASLFVAFTFIPALGARLLKTVPPAPADTAPGSPGAPIYIRLYRAMIAFTLRWPWLTVTCSLLVLGGSYYLFDKYVTRGILWGRWWGEDTSISIQIRLPRGEEISRTDELTRYFEAKLAALPEVERFVTNVTPQYASIRVTFPDSIEHTLIPVAIKEQLVAFSHQFGGAEVRVYGYGPSFYGGGGSPPNYSIQILGYNYERVREIAEDIGVRLKRFPRIRDVDTNASGAWYERDKATEIIVQVDRSRLALYDLTVRDLINHVNAAIRGHTEQRSARIRVGGDELQFSVKLEGSQRMDLLELERLLIPTPSGRQVRLSSVATLTEREVLNRILREDQQYQRRVSYEFRGPTKLGDRVQEAVIAATALPPGYTIKTRDEWRWSAEERGQIYRVTAIALVLIFMTTAALFESIRLPLCVLLTVPMALIGVFLIFFYTGASFTREAYIGVIMVSGIVVNNSILLVDHINQLRWKTGAALEDAILQGTIERVRPILMTSSTTILGLLPLVLFSEVADQNIWNALTYTLIGGLSSSTLLVLTVTPALYLLFERRAERRRRAALQTATRAGVPTPAPLGPAGD